MQLKQFSNKDLHELIKRKQNFMSRFCIILTKTGVSLIKTAVNDYIRKTASKPFLNPAQQTKWHDP